MKYVPEFTKEEMSFLNKMLGSGAFQECRGKLEHSILSYILDEIEKSDSPTNFLKNFDNFFGKVRIVANSLAQLKRDDKSGLYEIDSCDDSLFSQLCFSLRSPNYVFPDEVISLEEARPVTILMLNPQRVLLMLKWINSKHFGLRKEKDKSFNDFTNGVMQAFPILKLYAQHAISSNNYSEYYVAQALSDDVVTKFSNLETKLKDVGWLILDSGLQLEDIEMWGYHWLYYFEGQQSDILKRFTRQEQKNIASWQFNLSKRIIKPCIELHPGNIHPIYKKRYLGTSKGVSKGIGALAFSCMPVNRYDLVKKTKRKDLYSYFFK